MEIGTTNPDVEVAQIWPVEPIGNDDAHEPVIELMVVLALLSLAAVIPSYPMSLARDMPVGICNVA
jgi:hypothetical protein